MRSQIFMFGTFSVMKPRTQCLDSVGEGFENSETAPEEVVLDVLPSAFSGENTTEALR